MFYYAIVFLVLATCAGVFGFDGIAGTSAEIAKFLFIVFLIGLVVSTIANAFRGKNSV